MFPFHRLAWFFAAAVAFVGFAGPAAAHTGFESSDPPDGAVVDEPIGQITLVFTGEAEPAGEGFQVLEPDGVVRIPTESTSIDGNTWLLRFDPALAGGVIGVRWAVKAPDAHPIDGSFSFTVSALAPAVVTVESSVTAAAPAAAVASAQQEAPVDLEAFLEGNGARTSSALRLGALGRVLSLAGILVGVGGFVFATVVLRGAVRDIRYVLYWVRWSGLVVVAGATVELVAQLAVDGGGLWSSVWSPSSLGSVLFSSFGLAVALRIGGGLALTSGARLEVREAISVPDPVVAIRELVGVGARADHDRPAERPVRCTPYVHPDDQAWHPTVDSAGALFGAVALLVAHLFDGHTVSKGSRWVTGVIDLIHVAGAAVWVGGVLMLLAVLWRRYADRRDLRALQLALRFSVVATFALVAVGAAGIVLAVIILDSPSELWETPWGRLLLLKVVFVGMAAAAGSYNHKVLIPELSSAPDDRQLNAWFRSVLTGEAVALIAVMIVTAFLMGAAS